jgi:hypothetical protein
MPKLVRLPGGKLKRDPQGHKAGAIIDDPKAYLLVKQGVAEPHDKECADAAGMSPEAFEKAKYAYERLTHGVAQEDLDAYDRGLMIGYKPDGKKGDTWIPGPKWSAGCEAEYYSKQEDDDDDE